MSTELKSKLISLLEKRFNASDKVMFEQQLVEFIGEAGYYLQRRFTVKLSNNRMGFINYLVTAPDGQRCAIEVDKKTPRLRSLTKLNALPEGVTGFVLLRDGKHPLRYIADGIDVVRATKFEQVVSLG